MRPLNILILGDSWGTPNYVFPMSDYRAKNHFAELLADSGHRIVNLSENGASNGRIIGSALSHGPDFIGKPDVVIWLHTSLMRDWQDMRNMHIPGQNIDNVSAASALVIGAKQVYPRIRELLDKYDNPPLILVEGHGYALEPYLSQHVKPYHMFNMRELVIGKKLPRQHWISESGYLDQLTDYTKQEIEQVVANIEIISDAMSESGLFPDDSHPGDKAHRTLYNYLQPFLQKIANA